MNWKKITMSGILVTSSLCFTVSALASSNSTSTRETSSANSVEVGWSTSSDFNTALAKPNWISFIKNDNIKLSELSIPGTHDSLDLHGKTLFDKLYTQTQSWILSKQLQAGIRYIDVRVRRTGTTFAIHHGSVYQKQMFGDVLNDVANFLRQYPSETILMRVKEEYDAEKGSQFFEEIFNHYWNNYKSYFWNPTSNNPALGELRGKIVVLQNFTSNQQYGISYNKLNTQDDYDVTNLDSKWSAVKAQFDKASNDKSQIYLKHLSGTHYNLINGNTPEDVAKNINTKAMSYMPSIKHSGIVVADFPSTSLLPGIMLLNPLEGYYLDKPSYRE